MYTVSMLKICYLCVTRMTPGMVSHALWKLIIDLIQLLIIIWFSHTLYTGLGVDAKLLTFFIYYINQIILLLAATPPASRDSVFEGARRF